MPEDGAASLRAALATLDEARVPYAFRKDSASDLDPAPRRELDVLLARQDVPRADAALAQAGFRPLATPGHGGHRFYLAFSAGRWLKLDARLEDASPIPRGLRRLARRRPAGLRRLGPVVAVVGPDGAGKGTVIRRLAGEIPAEVKTLYLGWRKPRPDAAPRPPRASSSAGPLLESAFVLKGWLRAAAILLGGYAAAWRGAIVLCDRHPLDALAVRPRGSTIARALERALLSHLTPWPDAIVLLDAPTDVLVERKHGHAREVIAGWREGYAQLYGTRGGVLVSTDGPRDATAATASAVVWDALRRRRRWT